MSGQQVWRYCYLVPSWGWSQEHRLRTHHILQIHPESFPALSKGNTFHFITLIRSCPARTRELLMDPPWVMSQNSSCKRSQTSNSSVLPMAAASRPWFIWTSRQKWYHLVRSWYRDGEEDYTGHRGVSGAWEELSSFLELQECFSCLCGSNL